MRTVVQRARSASVEVDGAEVGRIGPGLVAFVAVQPGDGPAECEWTVRKLRTLRLFSGADGRMDLDVAAAGGGVLLVPNFTVAGRVGKGTRPDFGRAAPPDAARARFDELAEALRGTGLPVATGRFGADMRVQVEGDGPVTLILEREPRAAAGGPARET